VKRLLPESVACEEEALALLVPDCESEHPTQFVDAIVPELFI
jgi:hypothetical protein